MAVWIADDPDTLKKVGPLITVYIYGPHGKAQCLAQLDTGATFSAVDSHIAAELDLPTTGRTMTINGLGGSVELKTVDARIDFGPEPFTVTLPVLASDLSRHTFKAIIGWDILSRYRVTFGGGNWWSLTLE